MLLSVVLPTYNEAESITPLYQKLRDALAKLGCEPEFIFVDDGSTDATFPTLQNLAGTDRRVKVLSFSRNFGHQNALLAGIQAARGEAILMMDSDLQHPVESIPEFVQKFQQGFAIVQGVRADSAATGFFKRLASQCFYRLFAFVTGSPLIPQAADFRLISRAVADQINALPEQQLFLRGMIGWLGFKTALVKYPEGVRAFGQSKYTLRRMLQLAWHGVLAFTIKPIRLCILAGVMMFAFAFIYLGYVLYIRLVTQIAVPGWSSIVILLFFFQGMQFTLIGIVGEYIGRIYLESKRRPRYVIAQKLNFNE